MIAPSASFPVTGLRSESRRLAALAWPVILTHMNWSIMGVVDVMIVGHVSTDELAALAAARVVNWIFIVTGMAGLTGILVYAAQADGAGAIRQTGTILHAGLILSLLIAAAGFVLMLLLPGPLLSILGVAPQLVEPGAKVVTAHALGLPGLFLLTAASYFLEGISRPRRVMAVNLVILPLNALLDWLLAGGNLGFPQWGAFGAALATSISVTLGAAMILWVCRRLPRAESRHILQGGRQRWRVAMANVPGLARFGVMPAVSAALELAGFTFLIVLSTRIGLIATAAYQVIASLHTLTFALALGLASATGVRVGNAVGARVREQARPRTLIAAGLSLAVMAVPIILFLIAAGPIVVLFSDDHAVQRLATAMLFALAPFIFLDGLQAVAVSALRSLEDQVAAGWNGVIAFLVVLAGSAWWWVENGAGPMALIHAMQLSLGVAVLLQFGRLFWITRRSYRSS